MVVFDAFFKRQKRLRGELPDVFTYDDLPDQLRVQIIHVMYSQIGNNDDVQDYLIAYNVKNSYKTIVDIMRRELGVFQLPYNENVPINNHLREITNYILNEPDVEYVLTAIEVVCRLIEYYTDEVDYKKDADAKEKSASAIREINIRFKEHGVGYEYDGEIIKIDTELVHAQVVKPALSLLRNSHFTGAEEEFLKAYEHYRKGNQKEALNEALKAVESTLKAIFDKKEWLYNQNDTASKLIQVAFDNQLIPSFWQGHFSGLRSTLEAGVPTVRNRLSGHGQGLEQTNIPDHIVSYALHQTAAIIVFLVRAYEE